MKFPFIRPNMPLPAEWTKYLAPAYLQNRYSNFGPVHAEFQQRITAQLCPPGSHAVLTSSGTAAITAALLALDIRGNVLIPSFTFAATMQAVYEAGCTPVCCDVDGSTWQCGIEQVEALLGPFAIKAVVAVRPFGLCRSLSPLAGLCEERSVRLIIDSAAALGGAFPDGRLVGAEGVFETFSLHATKVLGIGEGGLLMAKEEWMPRLREVLNFGISTEHIGRGFNGKLNEFSSAVGLAVLDHFPQFVSQRRTAAGRYYKLMSRFTSVQAAEEPGNPPWQAFPIQLPDHIDAALMVRRAAKAGLELRRYYRPALHTTQEGGRGLPHACPVSQKLADTIVCLPIYSDVTSAEADEIVGIIGDVLSGLESSP